MAAVPLVSIVDDDLSALVSTGELVETFGYTVETFESGEAFLASRLLDRTRCLIADVQMRRMSGPQLQQHLIKSGTRIPVIFITAFPDNGTRDRVMKLGAIAYLTKPFDRTTLQKRLQRALRDWENIPRLAKP